MTEAVKAAHYEEIQATGEMVVNAGGKEIKLTSEFIVIEKAEKSVKEEKYVPHVIEPSFGLGRIMYCIFEHCFKMREEDVQRTYFDFPAIVAPVKCSILPLMDKPELSAKTLKLKQMLTKLGVTSKIDDSGASVGKRYARTDECGIPFAFTVDFDTLEDDSVTMRELGSMKQIRIPMADAGSLISSIVTQQATWSDACEKYPAFASSVDEKA